MLFDLIDLSLFIHHVPCCMFSNNFISDTDSSHFVFFLVFLTLQFFATFGGSTTIPFFNLSFIIHHSPYRVCVCLCFFLLMACLCVLCVRACVRPCACGVWPAHPSIYLHPSSSLRGCLRTNHQHLVNLHAPTSDRFKLSQKRSGAITRDGTMANDGRTRNLHY